MADLPRVVYLSAEPHGKEMLRFLNSLPCVVVEATTEDREMAWGKVPEYDLGLNFLGTHRIPADEIVKPRLGWVNVHPAPLPEFRGRNLCYHAIMSGAEEFGASIHYMNSDFDTGPLIEVIRFPILHRFTAGDLHERAITCCQILFRKWVPELLKGKVPAIEQSPADGRYYPRSPINDLVDLDSRQNRSIRALTVHPKHHARVLVGGKRYRIVPEEES